MDRIVDFELELRGPAGSYAAWAQVDRGRDSLPPHQGPFPVALDEDALRAAAGDADVYGAALTGMLFHEEALRTQLAAARATAEDRGAPLRLRLALTAGAEALHRLRWELLRLPGTSLPLCTREDILFSRYLPVGQDSSAPVPAKDALKALVAVASPGDLEQKGYANIDRGEQVERAKAGLPGLHIDWLPDGDADHCTLARLVECIPGRDVLYLVCHGRTGASGGVLLLEGEDGKGAFIPVADLATRLAGTFALPRLAVLVVCESAGAAEALGALGPALVTLGIPAVIAMHGALTFESAKRFLPALLRGLLEDGPAELAGAIDRAVSLARRAILDQPDAAAPVLFMGLKSGKLWAASAAPAQGAPAAAQPSTNAPLGTSIEPRMALYDALVNAFSTDELQDLCFRLGIDWDNLPGAAKPAKARAMIQFFRSRGRLEELVKMVKAERPNLNL